MMRGFYVVARETTRALPRDTSGRSRPARVESTAVSRLILAPLRRLAHRVWAWRILESVSRPDPCRLMGLDLVILPGVLHPKHFKSSRLLGRYVAALPLAGRRVADLGTGSGLLGLLAARSGGTVTALDINPLAIACARANAERNGLHDRMKVCLSDGFDGAPEGERYDLIVTNPPFYPRAVDGLADHAFAAGDGHAFMSRLAAAIDLRLAAGGEIVMIHSSDTDFAPVEAMMEARGLTAATVSVHRGLFETLTIRAFRREAPAR